MKKNTETQQRSKPRGSHTHTRMTDLACFVASITCMVSMITCALKYEYDKLCATETVKEPSCAPLPLVISKHSRNLSHG